MKLTSFFAALFLCIFSLETSAASYGGGSSGTMLGILGGFRYNNLEIPTNRAYNRTERATAGYETGLLLLIPVSDSVALRLGAVYAVRDMEFTTPQTAPTLTGRAKLGYVDLPASLQVTLFGSSFYLWFGQNIGVKVSDTCEVGPTSSSCNSWNAAPFNITSILGVGYNLFDIGSTGKFSVEAVYEYGLNNIFPAFQTNTTAINANAILKFGI